MTRNPVITSPPGLGTTNASETLSGADIILRVLAEQGVDTLFGYSGGAILPTYDAVFRHNEKNAAHAERQIKFVVPANEQAAGFMAAGYARASGKVRVFMVTSGPGAINALTPIATVTAIQYLSSSFADRCRVLRLAAMHSGKRPSSTSCRRTLSTCFSSPTQRSSSRHCEPRSNWPAPAGRDRLSWMCRKTFRTGRDPIMGEGRCIFAATPIDSGWWRKMRVWAGKKSRPSSLCYGRASGHCSMSVTGSRLRHISMGTGSS